MIGRGDQADIYLDRICPSNPLKFTFLQDAQKHRPALPGQITDLIKKQHSPFALSNRPGLRARAPVKAPFSCPNNSLSIK
jgi:hypothetical protein